MNDLIICQQFPDKGEVCLRGGPRTSEKPAWPAQCVRDVISACLMPDLGQSLRHRIDNDCRTLLDVNDPRRQSLQNSRALHTRAQLDVRHHLQHFLEPVGCRLCIDRIRVMNRHAWCGFKLGARMGSRPKTEMKMECLRMASLTSTGQLLTRSGQWSCVRLASTSALVHTANNRHMAVKQSNFSSISEACPSCQKWAESLY